MNAPRRKLLAIDDPLATAVTAPPVTPAASGPARRTERSEATAALYVRLPIAESERLALAAFELRTHKRTIVGALIAKHVDMTDEELRADLIAALGEYRDMLDRRRSAYPPIAPHVGGDMPRDAT